jgi:hypothetical protein
VYFVQIVYGSSPTVTKKVVGTLLRFSLRRFTVPSADMSARSGLADFQLSPAQSVEASLIAYIIQNDGAWAATKTFWPGRAMKWTGVPGPGLATRPPGPAPGRAGHEPVVECWTTSQRPNPGYA